MNIKKISRMRRATSLRKKFRELKACRLVVHRTSRHIYAQVIDCASFTLVSASTLEDCIAKQLKITSNKNAASLVGKVIAKRAMEKGITKLSFDRSGFKYHGRVQALAEAARKVGLCF
ncbi:50S ribosomal protein L18 [Blochmannia endosymbiont of Colobopsis nipponica]|uniref:50S ribosomal protein L18 n=1 Tax=Blochmannia endosymbiont of Colobopsis nipponica TaxID=2681987 RepID=UPI00177E7F3B|nr:50S ribosomal protein L18 [Blochmannia endosymbiont of Colobopsis nipponica]QOI11209.1 50S ribosomal protein L18 [Blochmannia endosymbiont of Colobopsis nipponica]